MKLFDSWGKKRIAGLFLAAALGAALLTSGCGGGKESAGKGGAKDRPLTIGLTNAPGGFNPLATSDLAGQFVNRFMFDTLLGQPEVYKFTPHLADSIDTKDKQTYTIKLNPKAQWSDGKPITADDVVFTLNLAANPQSVTSLGRYISFLQGLDGKGKLQSGTSIPGLKKIDDHTVEFKTKTPIDPNLVKYSLGFSVPIVPKHVYSKLDVKAIPNAKEVTNPTVFSGPYKFVKYVTNDHLELAANDKYVKGAPKIKRIFIKLQNDTALVVDLKAGKVTMNAGLGIGKIPVKEVDGLKADKKLSVETIPANTSQYMMVNNKKFNIDFRKAMVYAVNRQQMKDQLYKGHAEITPTLYTRPSPVFDPTVKDFPYDPAKAKEALAKSGFDTGKELTLLVPIGNSLREQSADIVQQNLKAIGINVKISKVDFPTLLAQARKGDFDLMLIGTAQPVDPDYSTYFAPGSLSNYSMTDDPELMKLFEQGVKETVFEKRKEVYHKIQHYLVDKQYQLVLYNEENFRVKDKNLVGGLKPFWEGSLDDVNTWYFK